MLLFFLKSETTLPLRAIAVKTSSQIFCHDAEGTVHGERALTWRPGIGLPQIPSVILANHLLTERVNSYNIGEYDYRQGWGFELWHVYEINTFTWYLE